MIEGADERGRAGSRRLSDAGLIHIDGVLDLLMADDSLHRQILVEFLQGQAFVMLVFLFVHHRRSEDILPVPSLFQEFQPDEALDEFLLFIQKFEQGRIHQRRFSGSGRSGDDSECS